MSWVVFSPFSHGFLPHVFISAFRNICRPPESSVCSSGLFDLCLLDFSFVFGSLGSTPRLGEPRARSFGVMSLQGSLGGNTGQTGNVVAMEDSTRGCEVTVN